MYKDCLDGKGPNRIAKEFEEESIPNWNGKATFFIILINCFALYL
nr:hypothetical protein [Clostridium estertheticum]